MQNSPYLLVIDGRIVYPAAGYVVMAWEAFAKQQNVKKEDLDVVIRDVRLHEALFLKHGGIIYLSYMYYLLL